MKKRWLVYVACAVTACASTEPLLDGTDPPEKQPLGAPDAATDGGLDAPSETDARPCDDCDYFPEACSPDAFCVNGPFDPDSPGGSLDFRASISVIRGRSRSDVWAAGAVGALAHFDGASWRTFDLGIQETMWALWLRDDSEVSLAGLRRLYARGVDVPDGGVGSADGSWALYSPSYVAGQVPTASARFAAAWAAPGAEWLWCGAQGSAGGLWRVRQLPSQPFEGGFGISTAACKTAGCSMVSSIHGWSASDLWAVGPAGATVRISGAQSDAPSVKAYDSQTLNALGGVWAASASEAWSVGAHGTIRHYSGDPTAWDVVADADVPTDVNLNAVWGSSSTDVWAVGDAGVVLHYDGKSWSRVKVAGLGSLRPRLETVWVAEPGHVWIGGHGVILSLGGKT